MSRSAIGLLLVIVGMAGCGAGPRASWDRAVAQEELGALGLGYYWQNAVPLDSRERIERIWHIDENVYCLTSRNRIYVYNATTGEFRWSKDLAHQGQRFYAPCHADRVVLRPGAGDELVAESRPTIPSEYDVVVLSTITDAMVLQRGTGKLLRTIDYSRAGFAANTGAASDGTHIFVAGVRAKVFALEIATGLTAWRAGTGVLVSACPVYMGGNLYVANQDGLVFAARAGIDRARKMWPYPEQPQASGAFASDFVVEDRGAFIGCQDYSVYAFEPAGGKPLWRFRCGAAVSQPVQVGQTNVYALAAGDAFYAIDLATGRQPAKWRLPEGRMVLAELGNEALVLNKRNELMAVDAAIGQVRTVAAMSGLNLFVANTRIPAIYAGSADGLLCCIRPKGAGHVVPAMLGKQGK